MIGSNVIIFPEAKTFRNTTVFIEIPTFTLIKLRNRSDFSII
jgi:hypothetical protein